MRRMATRRVSMLRAASRRSSALIVLNRFLIGLKSGQQGGR